MPSPPPDDGQLRAAMRKAFLKNAQQRRTLRETNDSGLIIPATKAAPSPEHYHIVYHVPKDEIAIPNYREVFISSREAYQKIHDMAKQAEPRVEWYDDGQVGLETRLHGRADLWWIVLEVAACIRSKCTRTLERKDLKRRLILLPGEKD
jgi:hypothetical protein